LPFLSIPCLFDEVGCDRAVDDAQRFAHQFWATGEQESQLERKTQHPLADGFMRQDFVYQQGSTLSHASGTATGTETPSFAVGTAERNQPFMVAGTALYAQKTMLQSATFEVLIEFL
jgi:hypothetical protein